jgi:site-specific recombinase XerD
MPHSHAPALARCVEAYLLDCQSRGLSPSTLKHYTRSLHLLSQLLPPGARWHTRAAMRQALAALQGHGYSKATLGMYLRAWKTLLAFAHHEGWIAEDLTRVVKVPRSEPRRDLILAPADMERLIHAALAGRTGKRDATILTLLFDTGLRAGELCALEVEHVDLHARLLTVPRGKMGSRVVPIGETLNELLRLWLWSHPTGHGPLFPSRNTGAALRPNSLWQLFDTLGNRAGMQVHPHQLRHSFAVNFLRNGGDVFTLQKIMGHAKLEMTLWYAALTDEDMKRRHAAASPADRLGRQVAVRDQGGEGADTSGVSQHALLVGSPRDTALHVL